MSQKSKKDWKKIRTGPPNKRKGKKRPEICKTSAYTLEIFAKLAGWPEEEKVFRIKIAFTLKRLEIGLQNRVYFTWGTIKKQIYLIWDPI
ncbi:MAG: hypothetical protein PHV51_08865 [Methanosarcinaceae archaeon]|nr:hypothetical protein [Methanosarcinaceae archaeon]